MSETSELSPASSPVLLDIVLYPNQPLGTTGFAVLMGAIVAVSAGLGAAFMAIGAWPVSGFFGLDVLLVYFAFKTAFRRARRAEFIRLDGARLLVAQVDPGGRRREWQFDPGWARVTLEEQPRPHGRLLIGSHGRQVTIGTFLNGDERREIAEALRGALCAYRGGA